MGKKRNIVHFAKGMAWKYDSNGNRVAVDTLREGNEVESACCGLNCCDNSITLPVNDSNSTSDFPAKFEFVKVGTDVVLRVTVDFGAGNIVKEVTLT